MRFDTRILMLGLVLAVTLLVRPTATPEFTGSIAPAAMMQTH